MRIRLKHHTATQLEKNMFHHLRLTSTLIALTAVGLSGCATRPANLDLALDKARSEALALSGSVPLLPALARYSGVAFQALDAVGWADEATGALREGSRWIGAAVDHVPDEFRNSYLHRSRAVPQLMAMAKRRLAS